MGGSDKGDGTCQRKLGIHLLACIAQYNVDFWNRAQLRNLIQGRSKEGCVANKGLPGSLRKTVQERRAVSRTSQDCDVPRQQGTGHNPIQNCRKTTAKGLFFFLENVCSTSIINRNKWLREINNSRLLLSSSLQLLSNFQKIDSSC